MVTRCTIYCDIKKGMVKMYLLLIKLIQVPWSIKTMLDLCLLVCLTFIPATLSISCPFKQNQTTNQTTTTTKQLKNSNSNNLYILISVCLFYCGFCISNQHLQVTGFLNSIAWYEKFSQETTKDCSFFLSFSTTFCCTQVSLSPSKKNGG